ncbi:hypothetical protein ACMD2_21514 [Ananas comosus]|uniref:Uncharacterized protein n=1 Tax=Ananas comosus TaxID=4615 RepID=A0A199W1M8_ANACO|nr:hypothetical protein ACMD2_21514 [Ananas comosus]
MLLLPLRFLSYFGDTRYGNCGNTTISEAKDMPIFHLHSVQLDPFKYDTTSNNGVNHSCSVVSLLFATQNPNKLGIRYSSSLLGVSYENSTSIAVIEAPTFYQPPNSFTWPCDMTVGKEVYLVKTLQAKYAQEYN